MEKINYKNGYLYCDVDANPANYKDVYSSGTECFEDITDNIVDSCRKNDFTIEEAEAVLSHYEIIFTNSNVWE